MNEHQDHSMLRHAGLVRFLPAGFIWLLGSLACCVGQFSATDKTLRSSADTGGKVVPFGPCPASISVAEINLGEESIYSLCKLHSVSEGGQPRWAFRAGT